LTCASPTDCSACDTDPSQGTFTNDGDGTCSLSCADGYFTDDGEADEAICTVCEGHNCATCVVDVAGGIGVSSTTTCTACDPDPPQGTFSNNGDGSCSLACVETYYSEDGTADGARCTACAAANCLTCASPTQCLTCDVAPIRGLFTNNGDGTCSLTCSDGFYSPDGEADAATCENCASSNCDICSSPTDCVKCDEDPEDGTFSLNNDGTCTLTCTSGFFTEDGSADHATCQRCRVDTMDRGACQGFAHASPLLPSAHQNVRIEDVTV